MAFANHQTMLKLRIVEMRNPIRDLPMVRNPGAAYAKPIANRNSVPLKSTSFTEPSRHAAPTTRTLPIQSVCNPTKNPHV
jgi:hypothetical protein